MSDQFKPFPCAECGGSVRMLKASGEQREYARGLSAEIPASVLIPKCDQCGETYFSAEDSERVDNLLRAARLEWQRTHVGAWIQGLVFATGISLRELEEACHVTPTYLSHVGNGSKLASPMLTTLLEMFVRHPEDLASCSAKTFLRSRDKSQRSYAGAIRTATVVWGKAELMQAQNDVHGASDTRMQA